MESKKTSLRLSERKLNRLKVLAEERGVSLNELLNKAIELYYIIESNVDSESEVFIHHPKNSDKDLIVPAGKHSIA